MPIVIRYVLWKLLLLLALAVPAPAAEPSPTLGAPPPEGAVVLFDGSGTERWRNGKMTEDGYLKAGTMTKDAFGDFRLHLEFLLDFPPEERKSGNSGVYLQRRYEIQILNSAHKKTAGGGDCGAIYRYEAPRVNAALPPGKWQSYDITFTAPRWEGKKKVRNARITVLHNGVTIHEDVEVSRKTGHGRPEGPEPGPILLQYHGNPVVYRNIWLVPKN
jgi:hypothetical protein